MNNENPDEESPAEAPVLLPAHTESSEPSKRTPIFKQKRFIIIAAIAALVIIAGVAAWLLLGNKPYAIQSQSDSPTRQSILGGAATVVDGMAQVSQDNESWQDLKADADLRQGDYIRTSPGARVVATLDDGSAIRINSNSTIRLASLASKNVIITNISGEVYTRVVKSDRTFSVKVGDESYTALGTAYKTINTETVKGVEVYQSQVSAKAAKHTVDEGKRYFDTATPDLAKKVTDIPLDQLQKDTFLQWNLGQDKENEEFKDKLGFLATLEKTPAPTPAPAPAPTPAPAASISLTGATTSKGVSLSWKVGSVAVTKGFKIILSKESSLKTSDITIVKDTAARSYTLSLTTGKTYYFQVCAYQTDGSCTGHSNSVKVTAPYVAPTPPSGTISLTPNGGKDLSWALNGSAPYGFKLVWSTSPNPTYPGSSASFYDKGTTNGNISGDPGTYYVRICMYYDGTCINYSNEVTTIIP